MNCKVTVKNGVDAFSSAGELLRTENGFKLLYSVDGDDCEISYDGAVLTQVRRGSLNVEMRFEEGAETLCNISDGVFSGGAPVFTKRLAVFDGAGGIKATINYDFGGEVFLELTALKIQEKK